MCERSTEGGEKPPGCGIRGIAVTPEAGPHDWSLFFFDKGGLSTATAGNLRLHYFPFLTISLFNVKRGSRVSTAVNRKAGMGTLNELCVSSLQAFLCPAVKTLQQDPQGKVKSDLSALKFVLPSFHVFHRLNPIKWLCLACVYWG